ncbi:MAG: hypothetical protein U9R17_00100 [Thermodesulfobacteriota bacterium]|nr:hypothetical protein [Thermodesulfobacteriota bacterium]
MEGKRINIAVPASGQDACRELIVYPNCTVKEIKRQFPIYEDYAIFKGWDSLPFKESVDIYDKVQPGDQLYAASYQEVGTGFERR